MRPRVIVVMGVSGSGKTSVARALASRVGWEFVEGDELHPATNVQKMSRGEALTDEDRGPWLCALRQAIDAHRTAGTRCVVTCSALRRDYRLVLRHPGETETVFVHLRGAASLIRRRMSARDHFMRPEMLESQFSTLEEPGPDEAIGVEIDRPVEDIVREIVDRLELDEGVGFAGRTGV